MHDFKNGRASVRENKFALTLPLCSSLLRKQAPIPGCPSCSARRTTNSPHRKAVPHSRRRCCDGFWLPLFCCRRNCRKPDGPPEEDRRDGAGVPFSPSVTSRGPGPESSINIVPIGVCQSSCLAVNRNAGNPLRLSRLEVSTPNVRCLRHADLPYPDLAAQEPDPISSPLRYGELAHDLGLIWPRPR